MVASLEWGGYSNGFIPASVLADVGGGILLENTCARQFSGWRSELAAAGIPLPANEGYRDYAGQVYWKAYWSARGKPGNAAAPGYSIHGWGKAVDLDISESQGTYPTVVDVGARYGFLFDVSGEDWHASFREGTVTSWASGTTTPIQEDDMFSDDDRGLARATNNGVVDTVVRLYRIEQKIDELRNWVGINKWVLTGNDTPGSGLRAMVAEGFNKLGATLDDIDDDVEEIKSTLPAANAPDMKAIVAPQ